MTILLAAGTCGLTGYLVGLGIQRWSEKYPNSFLESSFLREGGGIQAKRNHESLPLLKVSVIAAMALGILATYILVPIGLTLFLKMTFTAVSFGSAFMGVTHALHPDFILEIVSGK